MTKARLSFPTKKIHFVYFYNFISMYSLWVSQVKTIKPFFFLLLVYPKFESKKDIERSFFKKKVVMSKDNLKTLWKEVNTDSNFKTDRKRDCFWLWLYTYQVQSVGKKNQYEAITINSRLKLMCFFAMIFLRYSFLIFFQERHLRCLIALHKFFEYK